MDGQSIVNLATLVGTFLSAIGIWLALIQLRQIKTQHLKERASDAFDVICTTPAPNIANYSEVYEELYEYYKTIREDKAFLYTNKDYLIRCISRHRNINIQFRQKDKFYNFPIVSKREWLLSHNPDFKITVDSFRHEEIASNLPEIFADKFLKYFNIRDYSSYIAIKGRKIWNATTFDLIGISEKENGKQVGLSFGLGDYYRYVNTNELLSKELYMHLFSKGRLDYDYQEAISVFPDQYTLRHTISPSELFEFRKRPSSVGFHVFVIMKKNDNQYCTFIQKRGGSLLEYPGFFHVVPAGTFQPLSEFDGETIELQCNFPYTVLRELLEEVFDLEKADQSKSANPFNIFRLQIPTTNNETVSPGEELNIDENMALENEYYEIVPTGFFIDLLTLKPQISFVLHIKHPSFYEKTKTIFSGNWEGNIKEFVIDSDEYYRFLERNYDINGFPPAGAIAIAEGMDYFMTKLQR